MKKIIYFIFGLSVSFFIIPNVEASSCTLSGPSQLTVGSSGTITVSGTDASGKLDLSINSSAISINKNSAWISSNERDYITVQAKSVGTAVITAITDKSYGISNGSGGEVNISCSKTIKIVPANSDKSSSSSSPKSSSRSSSSSSKSSAANKTEDNKANTATLKSLSVDGQELSPKFDANVTDYSITVPNDVAKINIKATPTDSKAKIAGVGEHAVKEGENKFEIKVTAENGDVKTYTLKVTVDKKPIIVKIKGKEYTLIKNKEELPELNLEHEDITLTLEEQEVPAYRIDKLNYVLVGLKDSEGKINLYKFKAYKDNKKPDEYTLFKQVNSKALTIIYLDFPKKLIPSGYKKYAEEINGDKVIVYKSSKNSRYSLIYGINLETGKKNVYKYDTKEGTIQIYDTSELKQLDKKMEIMKAIILGLIGLAGLLLIIIIIVIATRNRKIKKALRKYAEKLKIRQEAQ